MTRILLVEDNPGDAVIFRETLDSSELEYDLVHAKRLGEGIERLGDTAFDILMVDLSLPDAHGMETVRRVREAAPHLPLIVLTGLDDASAAAEAKGLGAVDYLVKWYVDSSSLARYIRYAIAQNEMYGGARASPAGGAVEGVVEGQRVQAAAAAPARPAPSAAAPPASMSGEAASEGDDLLREIAEAALAFAEQAERRSAWMADVLRSALDLHRVAAGEVEVRAEMVDVLELARQAAGEQRDLAMRRGIPLHTDSDRKKVMAHADRNLVLRLLRRLVVDAVQSADGEGVRVRVAAEGKSTVVEAAWTESTSSPDAAADCLALGRSTVAQTAALAGGQSTHETDASGRHVLVLRLPGTEPE